MQKKEFIQRMREDLANDVKHNKTSVERIASSFGITDKNTVKEFTELAIVMEASRLAHQDVSIYERYMSIVDLYNKQVTLSHRTSQSMLLQQYSTPAPIGFIAGIFCGINEIHSPNDIFFEPSAGNGLLTIAGFPKHFFVNEIDETRRRNLYDQNFKVVKALDATKPFTEWNKTFDAVITNPPFGKYEPPLKVNEFEFSVLDHVMCIRALDTMKNKGLAALIIGGHTAWDDKGRIQAGKNRIFFAYLNKYYHVLDCINIDGHKLYSKQGTAFNVRLILIAGRKATPEGYPPLYNANRDVTIYTFEDLYHRVTKYIDDAGVLKPTETTYENNSTSDIEIEAEALALELKLMSLQGIKNNKIYYNSHGTTDTWANIREIEVEERGNYTNTDFNNWEKKYNIKPSDRTIWVTPNKKQAVSYMLPSEMYDKIMKMNESQLNKIILKLETEPIEFLDKQGVLIKETDDGDNGFLFVLKG